MVIPSQNTQSKAFFPRHSLVWDRQTDGWSAGQFANGRLYGNTFSFVSVAHAMQPTQHKQTELLPWTPTLPPPGISSTYLHTNLRTWHSQTGNLNFKLQPLLHYNTNSFIPKRLQFALSTHIEQLRQCINLLDFKLEPYKRQLVMKTDNGNTVMCLVG